MSKCKTLELSVITSSHELSVLLMKIADSIEGLWKIKRGGGEIDLNKFKECHDEIRSQAQEANKDFNKMCKDYIEYVDKGIEIFSFVEFVNRYNNEK